MYFSRLTARTGASREQALERLAHELSAADAIIVGAGAGLSTSAGFTYGGERFHRYFDDFSRAYGFHDMYAGGFFPFLTEGELWAFWSRNIWVNRYAPMPSDTYDVLRSLVEGKDYFVLTTNVDHCFQRAGFDKQRLFYTQGDYGLWQCPEPCHIATWDNEEQVRAMLEAQGFSIDSDGALKLPAGGLDACVRTVPEGLLPRCPVCGKPAAMNLRVDDTFVEDEGWRAAAEHYHDFLRRHEHARVLYLELGVGGNTPVIIKYPFWEVTAENPRATYACVNFGEAVCPVEIADRAILLDADIAEVLQSLR